MNKRDSGGNTAVMFAVKTGSPKCIALLIEAGAYVNIQDRGGFKSLLMMAVAAGRDECVKLLSETGAVVNINDSGITPLLLAAQSGSEVCVKQLVKSGAIVNSTNVRGETPLMLALLNNQVNIVDVLLQAGSDVGMFIKTGESTSHYALASGNPNLLRILIEAGADTWGHYLIRELINMGDFCPVKSRRKIKFALSAGAHVNVGNDNAIYDCVFNYEDAEIIKLVRLLFAAKEKMEDKSRRSLYATRQNMDDDSKKLLFTLGEEMDGYFKTLYFQLPAKEMSLIHLCREGIREHLLQMSNVNLIFLIPQLGLPSQITEYLLYGISPSNDIQINSNELSDTE